MVLNTKPSDDEVALLNGEAGILKAPVDVIQHPLFGHTELDQIHVILCPAGIIIPFELEPEEIRAIARGQTKFVLNFLEPNGVSPFRILFEKEPFEFNGTQETKLNNTELPFTE